MFVVDLAGLSVGTTAAGTEVKSDSVVFDSLEIVQVVVEFDTEYSMADIDHEMVALKTANLITALKVNNNPVPESHFEVAVVAWAAGDAPQV